MTTHPQSYPPELPDQDNRRRSTNFLWRYLPKNYGLRLTLEISLLVLAIVWFLTPLFARSYINRTLADLPDYTGSVERVGINPFTLSVNLYNFHIDKKTGKIPVHFVFSPYIHTSLQWSQLFHASVRASVFIHRPQINLVAGPSSSQSQLSISKVWIDTLKKLLPWRLNKIKVHGGDLHFRDFHANPPVDLEVSHIEIDAENLSNSSKLKVPLPATIRLTANPLFTGNIEMKIAVNLDEKYATFTQSFQMNHVPAVAANTALKKYLKAEVKSGEIGLYSEVSGDKGVYHGYVKPFFTNLEFTPKPEDQGTPGALWSGVLNGAKTLIENDQQVIATQTPISGRVDQPHIDVIGAIIGVLWNAYIQALQPGFDPSHSPPQPTDTVTTPQSTSTEKEAEQKTSIKW